MTKTTEKMLQKQKPWQQKDSFDGKCRKEIDKKRQLRIRYLESGSRKMRKGIKNKEFVEKMKKTHIGKILEMETN